MQTRHYDSKYGVNLICSECGTCVPVYRKTRPEPGQEGPSLFAMQTGESRAAYAERCYTCSGPVESGFIQCAECEGEE